MAGFVEGDGKGVKERPSTCEVGLQLVRPWLMVPGKSAAGLSLKNEKKNLLQLALMSFNVIREMKWNTVSSKF